MLDAILNAPLALAAYLSQPQWLVFFVGSAILLGIGIYETFDKKDPTAKSALLGTAFFFSTGLLFWGYVWRTLGTDAASKWLTGYVLEYSLSVDNLFVIGIVFAAFKLTPRQQRLALTWGILGAIVFRGVFIGAGAAIVMQWAWILALMGLFLVYSGYGITFMHGDDEGEEEPAMVQRVKRMGLSPLLGAIICVELVDVIFAIDSVPAILAVTADPFIAVTASMWAVYGLRKLYFCIQVMQKAFHHLPKAIGVVLMFIGVKIALASGGHLVEAINGLLGVHLPVPPELHIPTLLSLALTVGILVGGVVASYIWPEEPEKDEALATA